MAVRKGGMPMLTVKQRDLLLFVARYSRANGAAPSFDEMRIAMGVKSKSGIHRLVKSLEERRFVRCLPYRARSIEILRMPGAMAPNGSAAGSGDDSEMARVPLMGQIAAGTPIEAISNAMGVIDVPPDMRAQSGDHYALRVVGDSMRDAGILESDIAILRAQASADDGDIIVALIRGESATLKRLRRSRHRLHLEAANPDYPTQSYDFEDVVVQGRLVGLMRQY